MFSGVNDIGWVVSAGLEFALIFFLLLGPARKFFVLLPYLILDVATTSASTIVDILRGYSTQNTAAHASPFEKLYVHLYWTGEVLVDLTLFLMVIVLTYRATEGGPLRAAAQKLLTAVAVLAVVLPFLLFHPSFTPWPNGFFFNSTSQMLNFGGAIMNLALWTALIASKQRDPKLLTVSAGLGIVVTGAAISFGLRHFIMPSAGPLWIPNTLLMLTHLTGVMIWCWAFRPSAHRANLTPNAVTSS